MPSRNSVAPLPHRWAARWDQTREWMALGVVFIPLGERLLARYSEPGRHYHDARHVLNCLRALDDFPGRVRDTDAVEMALWYHDAIYDLHADPGANEADSAALFCDEFGLLATGLVDSKSVQGLILATRHDTEPEDSDQALIMDIDLGVLGADQVRYDTYAEDIRKEYAHVEESAYRVGRGAVLRSFLDRKSIYATRHFRKLLEKAARANLERELLTLG
jgi:predicted metal-dependent HD superfamily phosphohydrolase